MTNDNDVIISRPGRVILGCIGLSVRHLKKLLSRRNGRTRGYNWKVCRRNVIAGIAPLVEVDTICKLTMRGQCYNHLHFSIAAIKRAIKKAEKLNASCT